MKFLVAVVFVGCLAMVMANAVLTEEQLAKIKQFKKECIAETGIAEEVVKKAKAGETVDDPKLGDFMFCFMKKPGFLNEAGEYQIEPMKKILTEKYGEEVANKVIAECTKEKSATGPETALKLFKCCMEHQPKHDH